MQDQAFNLKPSKKYLFSIFIMLLSSMILLLMLPVHTGWKGMGVLILLVYGGQILLRYGCLRHPNAIVAIRRLSDGQWHIETPTNSYTALLCKDSTVTRLISILRFRDAGKRQKQSCIILSDSLDQAAHYRRLLVALRMR